MQQLSTDELVPHDDIAERIVICEALLDPEWTLPALLDILPDSAPFYDKRHKAIWGAIVGLHAAGKPINEETVTHCLRASDDLAATEFVTRTQIEPVTEWAFMSGPIYARRILESYFSRRASSSASHMLNIAHSDDPVSVKQDALASMFDGMMKFEIAGSEASMRSKFDSYLDRIVTMEAGQLVGPEWPWLDLTRLTAGISPLTVVAGRPGMGKSAFMLQAATHLALMGKSVFFWSGEMGFDQLIDRHVSQRCKIDNKKLQSGSISNAERGRVAKSAAKLQETNLHIDTQSATIPALKRRVLKATRGKLPDVIFIDYLGLVTSDQRHPNENGRITHIMAQINELRMDTGVPVVVGAQLNRALTGRQNPRPQLSDLRDSGSIEQDASMVLFIHRPDYYAIDGVSDRPNVAEIICAKNRSGETGQVDLYWQGSFTAFRDLQRDTVTL